jgi:hypothetical protein
MSTEDIQLAKKHIRSRFAALVLPRISEGLWSIYDNAKEVCEKSRQIDQTLRTFQNLLTRVPQWSADTLQTEVARIQEASRCPYLEELLTGLMITYLRAFAAIQYRTDRESVEVEFEKPDLNAFIHELYKESARYSWQYAYFFKTHGVSAEQQARNRREIDTLLQQALDTTIDTFLPWKSIAEQYFKAPLPAAQTAESVDTESESEEEEEEKRQVSFGEGTAEAAEEEEEAVEVVDEEEEDHPPKLMVSEEEASLNFDDIAPEEEAAEEKIDVLATEDTLELNL